MIQQFGDRGTQDFYHGTSSKAAMRMTSRLSITTLETNRKEFFAMIPSNREPTHPGEVLLHEFLKPKKMSQVVLAQKLGVSLQRVNTLINGKRDMTAET